MSQGPSGLAPLATRRREAQTCSSILFFLRSLRDKQFCNFEWTRTLSYPGESELRPNISSQKNKDIKVCCDSDTASQMCTRVRSNLVETLYGKGSKLLYH